MSFTDEATKEFASIVQRDLTGRHVSTDVSGWDRSLGAEYLYEAVEACIASAVVECPAWSNAARNHVYGLVRPVFIVPDGGTYVLVERPVPGGMLSGSYLTTLFNTLARLDASRIAGSLRAKAAGDDCLEVFPDGVDVVARYKTLGFTIRYAEYHTADDYEFCSHRYRRDRPGACSLTSWKKLLLRYCLLARVEDEQYCAAVHETRHNEERDLLRNIFETVYAESNATTVETTVGQNDIHSNVDISYNADQEEQTPIAQREASGAEEVFCPGADAFWSSEQEC
jgi:hypothetical protein